MEVRLLFQMEAMEKQGEVMTVYPCNLSSANADGSIKKFAISFQGVDFSISDTVSIIATLTEGNVAEITIGDDCKMAENTTILPNRNTVGSSVLTYNGDYYIAGTATITEDITARNIYLGK